MNNKYAFGCNEGISMKLKGKYIYSTKYIYICLTLCEGIFSCPNACSDSVSFFFWNIYLFLHTKFLRYAYNDFPIFYKFSLKQITANSGMSHLHFVMLSASSKVFFLNDHLAHQLVCFVADTCVIE